MDVCKIWRLDNISLFLLLLLKLILLLLLEISLILSLDLLFVDHDRTTLLQQQQYAAANNTPIDKFLIVQYCDLFDFDARSSIAN